MDNLNKTLWSESHRDAPPPFTSLSTDRMRLPGVSPVRRNHLADNVPAGNTLQSITTILPQAAAPIPQLNPIHQATTAPAVDRGRPNDLAPYSESRLYPFTYARHPSSHNPPVRLNDRLIDILYAHHQSLLVTPPTFPHSTRSGSNPDMSGRFIRS